MKIAPDDFNKELSKLTKAQLVDSFVRLNAENERLQDELNREFHIQIDLYRRIHREGLIGYGLGILASALSFLVWWFLT